jgi:hypothetical protein
LLDNRHVEGWRFAIVLTGVESIRMLCLGRKGDEENDAYPDYADDSENSRRDDAYAVATILAILLRCKACTASAEYRHGYDRCSYGG